MRTFEQAELDDIRGLYRDAKDKEAQIGVLCDLYDTDRASIFAALGMTAEAEAEEREAERERTKPRRKRFSAEEKAAAVAMVRAGATQREVAEKIGVCEYTLYSWMREARQKEGPTAGDTPKKRKAQAAGERPAEVQSPEETERAARGEKGDAAPAQPDDAARREEMLDFASRTLQELREGVDGLGSFTCAIAGVDLLSDDEWEMLERILHTVTGFAAGVETGIAIWRDWP